MSLDDRLILLFKLIPSTLQDFLGFGGFGKNHETGGLAIEAVNDPNSLFGSGMSLANVLGELEVGGFFRFGLTGDAEEVLGFGNDKEMGVLIKDFNARGQAGFRGGEPIRSNRDGISDG